MPQAQDALSRCCLVPLESLGESLSLLPHHRRTQHRRTQHRHTQERCTQDRHTQDRHTGRAHAGGLQEQLAVQGPGCRLARLRVADPALASCPRHHLLLTPSQPRAHGRHTLENEACALSSNISTCSLRAPGSGRQSSFSSLELHPLLCEAPRASPGARSICLTNRPSTCAWTSCRHLSAAQRDFPPHLPCRHPREAQLVLAGHCSHVAGVLGRPPQCPSIPRPEILLQTKGYSC